MPSTRVRAAARWRRLPRAVRIAVVVLAAPLFYLLPYALRSAGVEELAALVLGVVLALLVFVGAALVAIRTVPGTPGTPGTPDTPGRTDEPA